MFNFKSRKSNRTGNGMYDTINSRTYNAILGGTILYGFLINALIVAFATPLIAKISPITILIGYFVFCIAGSIMANKSKNPVVSFIGYNLIVAPIGVLLAICLPSYGADKILLAVLLVGVVTVIMLVASTIFPKFFSNLGIALFLSLLIGIIVEIVATLLGYRGDIFNWIFVVIFSLYIGYDWHKAQEYTKTVDNAIDSAIDLYLDLINLFVRILDLLDNN